MPAIIDFAGPGGAVRVLGIKLLGFTTQNVTKMLLCIALIAFLWGLSRGVKAFVRMILRGYKDLRPAFWSLQAINITVALLFIIGFASIWFDNPARLATAIGLISAGLAFALQRVVTAVAGYFIILRGQIFGVGDRISMGGVRGDVIALGYTRTTVMEMGQPPSVQMADPAMWVRARQYTGRIVTITNDKIFDEPVYNYTRDFPYIWEEIQLPIPYSADRGRAEEILLNAAEKHTVLITEMSREAIEAMTRRYFIQPIEIRPRVFYRLTDNWLELSVRFVVHEHGIREIKDAMNRDILAALDEAGIGVASSTQEIVGFPPVHIVDDLRTQKG